MNSIAVSASHLTSFHDEKLIFEDISFEIPKSSLCAIVGPNGAGKTTLIRSMLGLHDLAFGSVLYEGYTLSHVRKNISYVPQRKSVDWTFPITAYEVALMGTYIHYPFYVSLPDSAHQAARASLEEVGMVDMANVHINQLSGGQQQRIFIARALSQNSSVYVLDEPFAGVDNSTEKTLISLFKKLKQDNKTIVAVHHDLHTLYDYFDWVIVINKKVFYHGPLGPHVQSAIARAFE